MATCNLAWAEPAAVFRQVAQEPGCVFLDSALADGKLGRWSILAVHPHQILVSRDGKTTLTRQADGVILAEALAPWPLLERWLAPATEDSPFPFSCGGALGYFGYDLAYQLEDIGAVSRDELHIPDVWLGIFDHALVFDQQEKVVHLVNTGHGAQPGADQAARQAEQRRYWEHQLEIAGMAGEGEIPPPLAVTDLRSNHSAASYGAIVERALEYIRAGDIFQVNLSQRFVVSSDEQPLAVYLRLRRDNPAPFAAWINQGDFQVLSASPERVLLVQGTEVETRPIKGTRPRSQDPHEDRRLARELWDSEKDRAELIMIVDLHRNDLGRVCDYGSVVVPETMVLESYATVHHLVSVIHGRLRSDAGIGELLRSVLPAGSISGAPKVRAMQIIDELEQVRRGVYTGSIGYIGLDGRCDFNVAIRSMVMQQGAGVFQTGGGLVADSLPEEEYRETLHKARALFAAFGQDVYAWAEKWNGQGEQ